MNNVPIKTQNNMSYLKEIHTIEGKDKYYVMPPQNANCKISSLHAIIHAVGPRLFATYDDESMKEMPADLKILGPESIKAIYPQINSNYLIELKNYTGPARDDLTLEEMTQLWSDYDVGVIEYCIGESLSLKSIFNKYQGDINPLLEETATIFAEYSKREILIEEETDDSSRQIWSANETHTLPNATDTEENAGETTEQDDHL